ncbi:Dephospho-CoA kinase [Pseudoalteromonas luteoviolacea B = ATCC 29581]|nr:Dephospho-CoA kinase [Pseudoalteromonas luteoviolacea B = ATCC 29581]
MSHWIVGVTGGIGAGKTAVTNKLHEWGIDIVDADVIAREVVLPGTQALTDIQIHFGDEVILPSGELNRAKLREIIFQHPNEKTWLNALLHPLIRQTIVAQLHAAQSNYVVLAAPLLFENNLHILCNRSLLVDVPVETQLERTINRDLVPKKQVEAIIAAQMSRKDKLALADDVIDNSHTLEQTYTKLNTLHQTYLKLASKTKLIAT